jgi:hypothetical protein
MAWTQSDVDKLEQAISSGVRSVTFQDGRRTEYQNTAEMLSALKLVRQDVAAATAPRRRGPRFIVGRVGRI